MSAECCRVDDGPDDAPGDGSTEASPTLIAPVRARWWRERDMMCAGLAGILLLGGAVAGVFGAETLAMTLYALALVSGASTFAPGAVRGLLRGRLGVALLMTIAAAGSVLLGHIGEAAALAFLFSAAEALEDLAMGRAKEGLRALMSLIPDTVRVSRAGGDEVIPGAEVVRGDILVVGAGERVATDGTLVEGRTSLDMSAITGESIPIPAVVGDEVIAGAINGAGTVRIQATADGTDNSLTRIVALVERAHARKGRHARLADRIARPLVPAVLVVAAGVALFGVLTGDPGLWIERALVVLVAASPCALAIAVPVTVISAIGAASKLGVVITSGQAFEQFGTIRTMAFDKTGTLTAGRPEVIEVAVAPSCSRDDVLAWAGAVEAASSHPLAGAIMQAASRRPSAGEVREDAGRGISGVVEGRSVRVGSAQWVDPGELRESADSMQRDGMTTVVVEADHMAVGVIGVRDELRPEAAETVRMLHDRGLRTVMLTGDAESTARALARDVGIDDVRARQLPADKAAAVAVLSGEGPTAMVGDGINDAPALATATVGIAIGSGGSAAAIESADIAFAGHDLRMLADALAHARRGRRIMIANIVLALGIIVVLFPLALFGVLGLAGVVLVHELAEVVVILNGIRAARIVRSPRDRSPAVVRGQVVTAR